jgi:hypothetical protein
MQGKELTLLFPGTFRDEFLDVKFPEFDGSSVDVTLDRMFCPANLVPFRFHEGSFYFVQGEDFAPSTLMCVFKLNGDHTADDCMKVIGAWTHELNLDPEKYHVSMRTLGDEKMRLFVYRVYMNTEGECFEHPEMLAGAPIGMYHCPYCGFMVVAGVPHPTKAQIEEFENETGEPKGSMEDDPHWEPGDTECYVPPYTDEQVAVLNEEHEKERAAQRTFETKFGVVENAFNSYEKLEFDWGGNGEDAPVPAYMQTAQTFISLMKLTPRIDEMRPGLPMLDHEGVPGIFWPASEPEKDNYFSIAFYENEIIWFVKSPDSQGGSSGNFHLVPLDGNVEAHIEKLVDMIVNYPKRNLETDMREPRKMKFREQRGSLSAALETVVTIDATKEAVAAHARMILKRYDLLDPEEIDREMIAANITSEAYGFDDRIQWDSYLVTSTYEHMKIVGYHDGPLED